MIRNHPEIQAALDAYVRAQQEREEAEQALQDAEARRAALAQQKSAAVNAVTQAQNAVNAAQDSLEAARKQLKEAEGNLAGGRPDAAKKKADGARKKAQRAKDAADEAVKEAERVRDRARENEGICAEGTRRQVRTESRFVWEKVSAPFKVPSTVVAENEIEGYLKRMGDLGAFQSVLSTIVGTVGDKIILTPDADEMIDQIFAGWDRITESRLLWEIYIRVDGYDEERPVYQVCRNGRFVEETGLVQRGQN